FEQKDWHRQQHDLGLLRFAHKITGRPKSRSSQRLKRREAGALSVHAREVGGDSIALSQRSRRYVLIARSSAPTRTTRVPRRRRSRRIRLLRSVGRRSRVRIHTSFFSNACRLIK